MEDNKQVVDKGAVEEPKTYTQEEVDALLQAEADRRVSSALKKAEAKADARVKEAEKLAKMSADEAYEYQLAQREQAIAAKEKELAMAENKNVASRILAEKGLNLSLVDFIVAEDAETTKNNIDLLDRAFKASVKVEVEKRLASSSSAPKVSLDTSKGMSKEQFNKLSITEKMLLKAQDPDLYATLRN